MSDDQSELPAPIEAHPLITVFGASSTASDSAEWQQAHALGAALAHKGYGIVTGGYGGSMEAVSAGAAAAGAGVPVVGVTVPEVFRNRVGANAHVTREIRARSLLARIEAMLEAAVAAVALPGSIGTFTEVMVAWNLAFVGRFSGVDPRPLVTVGETWRRLCSQVGEHTGTDMGLVISVATVHDVLPALDGLLGSGRAAPRAGS